MKLSKNFSLSEFTRSETANALGIDNTPPAAIIENLRRLCVTLEQVREIIGRPITISSGYRSPALNKAIRGAQSSQHRLGCAADIIVTGMPAASVMAIIVDAVTYDQLILESLGGKEWVHISVPNSQSATPRRQALIIDKKGVRPYSD